MPRNALSRPATSPAKSRSALIPRLNLSKRSPLKSFRRTHSVALTPALTAPAPARPRVNRTPQAKENSPKNRVVASPSQASTTSYSSRRSLFTPSKAQSRLNNRYSSANFSDSASSFDLAVKGDARPTTASNVQENDKNRDRAPSAPGKGVERPLSSPAKSKVSRSPIAALRRSISSLISPRRYKKLSPSLTKRLINIPVETTSMVTSNKSAIKKDSTNGTDLPSDARSTSEESYGSDEFVPLPVESA